MQETSILMIARIFTKAACEVINRSCQIEMAYSKTAQIIPATEMSKDIGSFMSFNGDYNGLMVLNFEGEAALELIASYLQAMGIPQNEIPTHYLADDVVNSIGELTNHIMGKARTDMQTKYDLVAYSNIPAVVPVTIPIGLLFKAGNLPGTSCVRVSFCTPQNHHIHMEITVEPSLLVSLENSS